MELEHEAFGLELWPLKERFDRLEETLAYLRAAFADGAVGFAGDYYRLDEIDVRPKPTGKLPIVVGGSGPERTPYLAGTYADEFNIGIKDPATLVDRIGKVRAAATKADRDPDAIKFSVTTPVLTGADEASYQRRLAAAAATRDRTPQEHENVWRAAGVPVGTADAVRRLLDDIAGAGVQRIYVQHFAGPDDQEFAEVFDSLGA